MPRVLGQPGGPVIKGFNAPNRVIITRNAQPGQRIQLAVFGINGPISYSPQNFIWIKSATLDFYKAPTVSISETPAQIIRKDPALDEIVPAAAKIEKLAGGFLFTARKTRTATFSLAIPTTISFTAGRKTANCRSS
jgi:gluconolactonase